MGVDGGESDGQAEPGDKKREGEKREQSQCSGEMGLTQVRKSHGDVIESRQTRHASVDFVTPFGFLSSLAIYSIT